MTYTLWGTMATNANLQPQNTLTTQAKQQAINGEMEAKTYFTCTFLQFYHQVLGWLFLEQ